MPNYDEKTGIHYGVIHQGKVLQSWCDESEPESDSDDEHIGWSYEKEGYICTQGEPPNIMLIKSPYYTLARPCSPCYPNAGDLDSTENGTFKTYCFGHDDWFDGPAPYPVYSVKTNELIAVPEYLK